MIVDDVHHHRDDTVKHKQCALQLLGIGRTRACAEASDIEEQHGGSQAASRANRDVVNGRCNPPICDGIKAIAQTSRQRIESLS